MRTFVLTLCLIAAWLVSAWSLMLMVGIAHLDWWSVIPLMSYGTAVSITAVSVAAVVLGQVLKAVVEAVSS
jgi:hypothetical protein